MEPIPVWNIAARVQAHRKVREEMHRDMQRLKLHIEQRKLVPTHFGNEHGFDIHVLYEYPKVEDARKEWHAITWDLKQLPDPPESKPIWASHLQKSTTLFGQPNTLYNRYAFQPKELLEHSIRNHKPSLRQTLKNLFLDWL